MQLESNTPVTKFDILDHYEEGDFINQSAFVPIKGLRVLTGLISNFTVKINFPNSISLLTLTSDMFISVRLVGALGSA